ncbi:MAG: hypothetical protein RLZZ427_112 [Pseudomonadota bacterium]|jgi:hypothetical protein
MRLLIVPVAAVAFAGFAAAPATAQEAPEPKVNQLIVYGNDTCPESTDDTITVCARKAEAERFRIPKNLREPVNRPSSEAWNNKVLAYETVGSSGTNSCSATGSGGWTGCSAKLINAAYAEKKNASDVRFGELIAAERAKRLSTIDAEAGETQQRVEQAEKDYEAREKANAEAQQAPAPAVDAPPPELNARPATKP